MTPSLFIAAAALTAAAPVPAADSSSVTGVYQARTDMFCVRAGDLDLATRTGTRIYRRECMTQDQWRERGVRFVRPVRTALTTAKS